MTAIYNPFEPGYIENPYPRLRELRETDPVHHSPAGFWLLTRYEDMNTALRDTDRFSVDHRKATGSAGQENVTAERIPVILFRDPPDHTRLRKLLSKGLTPTSVVRFRPRVRELATGLIEGMADKGECDVITELANELPFLVISEMLGMPPGDHERVRRWTADIVNITEPITSQEVAEAIVRSTDEMRAYLAEVIAGKRSRPADDLISAMATEEADGDRFTEEELIDHVMLLHVSAHEPTVNHLAHGMFALAGNPDQAALLRENPALDGNAAEELLRYEAPLQLTGRIALEDLDIDGHRIEAGSAVVMSLAAANHDPARWGATADELDLARPRAHDHLSFARGVHTCFGAGLARVQGQEVFGPLVRRFPRLTVAVPPRWNGKLNGRGFDELRLSCSGG